MRSARPYIGVAIVLSFLLTACGGGPGMVTARLGEEFRLKGGQSATIEGEGLTITFSGVAEDSRCPVGVECFWAGRVIVVLDVDKDGQRLGEISLKWSAGGAPPSEEVSGYMLELRSVEPHPRQDAQPIPLADYTITLVVSR